MRKKSYLLLMLVMVLIGCAGPQLSVKDLEIDSFDGTVLHYTATISNRESPGPGLCTPAAANGPIILQACMRLTSLAILEKFGNG